MFKRRDIPPVLLLLLLIVLVMLTLSQILVVHNGRYGRSVHSMRKLQLELRQMDLNLHALMMQNVPSVELNRRILANQVNANRVANILAEAAKPNLSASMTNDMDHHHTRELHSQPRDDNATDPLNNRTKMEYCPEIPPGLIGRLFIDLNDPPNSTVKAILAANPHIQPGGVGRPSHCTARHKVLIILPYRDREIHLRILLSHLHPLLHRQQLDYRVVVVEQSGKDTFNKARIMNIAFVEALKLFRFQCVVFHDVDLVPEDDRNMYSCPKLPRHMSVAIDEMGYKLAYQELVGGVLAMRTEHFQLLNGYSNLYWGWGAEDDDMAYRIMYVGLQITRPPMTVARYKMVKHTKRKPSDWRKRAKLLYTGTRRFQFDGLNSLQYRLLHVEERELFTHILVDIGKPPRGFR